MHHLSGNRTGHGPKGILRRFARSREAGILPLVALCGMALIGFVGFALDTGRQTMMQSQLQSSIDAAGLSAVARLNTSEIEDEVRRFTLANFSGGFVQAEITDLKAQLSADEETVTIQASVEAPSSFMQIFGVPRLRASAFTEITRAMGGLELVLVLDVTGSMNWAATGGGTRLQALKQASKDLLDILFAGEEDASKLHVGIVPFSHTVNIGTRHSNWLTSRPSGWAGCIEARAGLDGTDQPPDIVSRRFTASTSSSCPPAVTPMTSRKSTVVSAIDSLTAVGGTHVNYGAVWGWRMLSPKWRGYWGGTMQGTLPLDYDAGHMSKAIVLMTDGMNEWGSSSAAYPGVRVCQIVWGFSVCNNNGVPPQHFPGAGNATQVNSALDTRLEEVCETAKRTGIIVYTVAFDSPGTAIENRMRDCATQPAYFFNSPSASELRTAFAKIGDSLAALRVSR